MKTPLKNDFSDKLSRQFGLLMVAILFLSMLGSSWFEYENSNRITEETLNSRITSIGQLLTSISIDSLLVDDFVAIDDYLLSAVSQKDFVYTILFGVNGNILSRHINQQSSLVSEITQQVNETDLDEIVGQLNRHADIVAKSFTVKFENNKIGNIALALNRQAYDLAAQKKLYKNLIFTVLSSLFAGIAIYLIFNQRILRPINELKSIVNHVTHNELNHKINLSGNNELTELAATFNHMSDHLAKSIEEKNLTMDELKALNESLEEKIQQRTQDLLDSNKLLSHLSNHDTLTSLPNRALGIDRLKQNLISSKRKKNKAVLFFIDLDRFKNINDTLGHGTGDQILIETSKRIIDVVRADDTVSRIGGDEFLVMLRDIDKKEDIEYLAANINRVINEKFLIHGRELYIGCSIGIAIGPDDSDDAETLLRLADHAMYKAKELGRNHFQYYTRAMNEEFDQRQLMESLLSLALAKGELTVVYQPIIRSSDNKISGAEALLRWNSNQLGFISPEVFIPVMEKNGLIITIGDWVLRQACQMTSTWHDKFDYDGSIAVNISAVQLRTHQFAGHVENILKETEIPASKLHIELTERILIEESADIVSCLDYLHKLGVKFSIDDFGTGYSSLGYLKHFPGDIIKIDKSFTQDIKKDKDDEALVDAIIGIGHSLSRELVAEGVETAAQIDFLKARQCEYLQGYYYSKPVKADEFEKLIIHSPWIELV